MKASDLSSVLKLAIAQKWAILIEGSPGIGKSDLVVQALREINKANGDAIFSRVKKGEITQAQALALVEETQTDLIICHPVISDPTDFKGLPGIVNGQAEFLPYGDLRRLQNATRPLVCFLEDLGTGSQATQAALMQPVLAREINGVKIPDCVTFIGATNRRADGAAVAGIITPLRSRFRATVELTVDAADWCKWALAKGLPLDLIAFVQLRPQMLNTFDPKSAKEGKPFACPRTVAFLGDWLAAGVDSPEVVCGCVGEAFGTEFLGFRAIYKAVAGLPAQVVANPKTAPIPAEVDRMFALSAALSYYATPKNIDAIGQYADRISSEFRTFFWKAATARRPELVETNAHQNWAISHPEDIQ